MYKHYVELAEASMRPEHGCSGNACNGWLILVLKAQLQ